MKALLKIASLAILSLAVLTSCSMDDQNPVSPEMGSENKERGKGFNKVDSNPLGLDLTGVSSNWQQLPGIKYLSAGSSKFVYGYDGNGKVYKWGELICPDGDKSVKYGWNPIPGTLAYKTIHDVYSRSIAVSEDGNSVWGIEQTPKNTCKWNGKAWITKNLSQANFDPINDDCLVKIAAGNNDNVWCITKCGVANYYKGGWIKENGSGMSSNISFYDIAVTPNGLGVYASIHRRSTSNVEEIAVRESNGVWRVLAKTNGVRELSVTNSGEIYGINYYDNLVKLQGDNWLVVGQAIGDSWGGYRALSVTGDGKQIWRTYGGGTCYRMDIGTIKEPAAPANNPNTKFTIMNRALLDATMKNFGLSNWSAHNINTTEGKTAIRDLYMGAFDQAITQGTLTVYASLFAGGIGGTEYNNFVTSNREITLNGFNVLFSLANPTEIAPLGATAEAIKKEIIEWRGCGMEDPDHLVPGFYTYADLRNFLTTINSKIATANITERERKVLYGITYDKWEYQAYLMSSPYKDRVKNLINSSQSKASIFSYRFWSAFWDGFLQGLGYGEKVARTLDQYHLMPEDPRRNFETRLYFYGGSALIIGLYRGYSEP